MILERKKALLDIRKQRHENHAVQSSFTLICTKIAPLSPSFEIFSEILVQVCYAKAIFLRNHIDYQVFAYVEKLTKYNFRQQKKCHMLRIFNHRHNMDIA